MSGQPRAGASTQPSAYDTSTSADLIPEYELGAWCLALAVISLPAVIVGGIYLGYQMFVSWSGLPS